jgi:hypothetical protein
MELDPETQSREPTLVVLELRSRMAKLDRVDEIVEAVDSMRISMRGAKHETHDLIQRAERRRAPELARSRAPRTVSGLESKDAVRRRGRVDRTDALAPHR